MTQTPTPLLLAVTAYQQEHAKLAPLKAAQAAAHAEAYDERGLPTNAPGAHEKHMQALEAHEAQQRQVQQARAELCSAALDTDVAGLTAGTAHA